MDFVDTIERYFRLDPTAQALLFDGKWLTYGDLTTAIEHFTERLRHAGVGPGDAVAVVVPNSPGAVVALLAILRLRACAVPLSPRRPEKELASVGDVRAVARPPDGALADAADIELTPASERDSRYDGVAISLATSGTTGEPKRVPIPYTSIDASLAGTRAMAKGKRENGLRPELNIVCYPMYHLSGILPLLITFLSGRRTALLPKFEPYEVARLVRDFAISSLALNPTSLRMLLDSDVDPADLASLRFVRCGSAPLAPRLAAEFEERFGAAVLQAYGQTETGGEVIGWSTLDYERYGVTRRGSVGRPHPGITVRIVPPDATPEEDELPPGEPGEMWLQGVRGHDGWHRTGDVARVDSEGFVWIEGRADDVILCGGFNIAPLAVERVLERHPGVGEVAVVGVADDRLGEIPVAVVVPRDGSVDDDDLRAWCRRDLEPYQVPRQFVYVERLPRTDSAKVRRSAVREIASAATFVGPGTPSAT